MKHIATAIATLSISLAAGLAFAGEHSKPHWGYSGAASDEAWGKLDPSYAVCAEGKEQSPINIVDGDAVMLPSLKPVYGEIKGKLIHNGHTIQLNLPKTSKAHLMAGNVAYKLLQLHFHTPSEHSVRGSFYPIEMHLVHQDADGKLAVLGVMLEASHTAESDYPELERLFAAMKPLKKNGDAVDITIDPALFLPTQLRYSTYHGSLTTPPCSEGVLWRVLSKPVSLSAEHVEAFRSLFDDNARSVRPMGERKLFLQY